MENSKFIKTGKTYFFFLLPAITVLIVALIFSFVYAYSPYYTHPDLTEEIAKLWNLKNNNQNLEISQREIQWMRQGAINEDTPARWINHFYDPIHNTGWSGEHFGYLTPEEGLYEGESMAPKPAIASINWVTNQEYQSAYGRQYGNQTWQKALKAYVDSDRKTAFTALGHILHLIEDASVPDHTRNDTHADLYGDPGSPYENYSKEYTNFNKFAVAENLKNSNFLYFSTIQDAFNHLANYSNNNFFSEDTISNDEFANPNLEKLEKKIENIDNEKSLFLYNKQKKVYLAILQDGKKYSTNDKVFILPSYFSSLTSQAVLTGASVMDLFFSEAERYKQNPELLPEIIPDSNEATLSYLKKSPRLLAVNASDIYERASTNVQIYYASATSFFSSVFSTPLSFLSASVVGIPQAQPATQPIVSQAPPAPVASSEDINIVAPQTADIAPPTSQIISSVAQPPSQITASIVSPTSPSLNTNLWIPDVDRLVATTTVAAAATTTTGQTYQGRGYVSGVSSDISSAEAKPMYDIILSSDNSAGADIVASITTEIIATSTDDVATSTPDTVTDTATSTDSVATSTESVAISTTPEIIYDDPVVINEIAWMGTRASYTDEWIELYNKTGADIDLSGWTLESRNKSPNIRLAGVIKANSYFLLERTASTTTDQAEDMIFTGAINNSGPESNLYLKNGSTTIDYIDMGYWPAGGSTAANSRRSMERVSPYAIGNYSSNWKTYSEDLTAPFAKDAKGSNIFGTPGALNSASGLYTPAGHITKDTIWEKKASPYYVPSVITVSVGSTLTIEPGVVVKFIKGERSGGGLNVEGVLRAEGTEQKHIIFTSSADDVVDGVDLDCDGTSAVSASADWKNINLLNPAKPSLLKYAEIRYGGQGTSNNPNGWYPDYTGAVNIQNSSPEISHSVISSSTAAAIYIKGDSYPKINQNRFSNTVAPVGYRSYLGGTGIRLADASSTADIIGNLFENNNVAIASRSASTTPLAVRDNTFRGNNKNSEFYSVGWLNLDNSGNHDFDFKGGFHAAFRVTKDKSVTLKADDMPYIFDGGEFITVDEGGTLSIEPGAVLKNRAVEHTIRGTLTARGAPENPIIFTALGDDSDGYDSNFATTTPQDGAWKNIQFIGASSSDSVLEYVQVRYGGEGTNYNPNGWYPTYTGAVNIQDSSPRLANVTIENSRAIGLNIKGQARPTIKNSVIKDTITPTGYSGAPNYNYGLYLADAVSSAEITDNRFENNETAIRSESASDSSLIIKDNTFSNNRDNGVFSGYANFNLDNTNNHDKNNRGGFRVSFNVANGQDKTLKADAMPYIISGLNVAAGGVLAIEPGAVLKSANNILYAIRGALKAHGTAEKPIVFTALADDSDGYDSNLSGALPQEGAWKNIQFIGASSSDSILENVEVRYGGSGADTCPHAYLGGPCMAYEGAVLIDGSSPVINNSTLDRNLAIALYVKGEASPAISNSAVTNTKEAMATPRTTIGGYGLSIGAESSPTLTGNTYGGNVQDVVYR